MVIRFWTARADRSIQKKEGSLIVQERFNSEIKGNQYWFQLPADVRTNLEFHFIAMVRERREELQKRAYRAKAYAEMGVGR